MSKTQFFNELRISLKNFREEEVKKIIAFYDELIEEKKENGITEDDAIASFGDIKNIVNTVSADLVMERTEDKKPRTMSNFFIILGICASPILLPIGIAFFTVFISIVIVFFALVFSFAVSAFAILISTFPITYQLIMDGVDISVIMMAIGGCLIATGVLTILTIITFKLGNYILNAIIKLFTKLIKKKSNKGEI